MGAPLTAPYALRSVILYPLNALVEDQIRRLRRTLESPDIHNWLDQNRRGNRILFGRYTGQTAVSGRRFRRNDQGELKPNLTAINRLRRRLRDIAGEHADVFASPTTRASPTPNACKYGRRFATTSRTLPGARCGPAGTCRKRRQIS